MRLYEYNVETRGGSAPTGRKLQEAIEIGRMSMAEQAENTELKAAQAKKAAGQELTPAEEVLIAVDATNTAAGHVVEAGLNHTESPGIEPTRKS